MSTIAAPPLTDGVLLATDGDDQSASAARFAAAFSARRHVALEVIGVVEPISGFEQYLDERRQQMSVAVADLLQRSPELSDAPVAIESGLPAECIAGRARARGAALIALGIGQHEVLDRVLGIETAIGVLRRSSVPVLAASPDAAPPARTIIIATDFSPSAQRAAHLALAFAADDATVHLVHAWPWMDLGGSGAVVWRHVYRTGTQHLFDELLQSLPIPPRARVVRHLEHGEARTVVRDLAREHHADLIALGSHGRGFIDRLTLGSVAESVLRTAECSVLIAPPTEAEKE